METRGRVRCTSLCGRGQRSARQRSLCQFLDLAFSRWEVQTADLHSSGVTFSKQPTVVFLSGKDCILPIPKLLDYFTKSKFGKIVEGTSASRLRVYKSGSDPVPTTNGSVSNRPTSNKELVKKEQTGDAEEGSVRIMSKLEHAAILLRPGWCREVAKSIDQVGKKAEEWEQRERIELLL